MTEEQFQQAVIDLARLRGWKHYHPYSSRKSVPGWPDLFMVHPRTGQVVVAELKSATGRLSRAQREWIDTFAVAGIQVHVWRPAHFTTGHIQRALTPRRRGEDRMTDLAPASSSPRRRRAICTRGDHR